jgi:hypothetical protein
MPMSLTLTIPLFLAFGLTAGELPRPQAADWLAEHDAQTLKAAGIRRDDAGLLAFLGTLRPPPVDRRHVAELVAQLGHDDFTRREQATRRLTQIAGLARGELERASKSKDREVARRARAILDEYEAGAALREDALLAALREVTRMKMAGAVPALLETPLVWERTDFRKAAEKALNACYRPADAEALKRTLGAPNPHRRAAAAVCLLNRGDRRSLAVLGGSSMLRTWRSVIGPAGCCGP